MSDHIPLHIQEDIMKRLPVKSLIRFRSVSKAWKSSIESSEFIVAHSLRSHTQPQHLLLSWEERKEGVNYECYIDDDTFPNQRPVRTFPLSAKQLVPPRVIGSSQGLLCLYDGGIDPNSKKMAVVWNPSIRKSIVVVVPNTPFVGFGVCPVTGDPKIMTVAQYKATFETSIRTEVMVYTLSSGKWRSLSGNLPAKRIQEYWSGVAADGFIYCRAESQTCNMILSFDVTNESFEAIDLPDTLAHHDIGYLDICKLKESLAIVQYDRSIEVYTVWMMEGGVHRSFTKLFTVHEPLMGFKKSGVPIVNGSNDGPFKLLVYEPNSEHNNVLEFSGNTQFVDVNSYMETLLLLGRSDCISY